MASSWAPAGYSWTLPAPSRALEGTAWPLLATSWASAGLPGSPPAACPVSRGLHLQLFTVTQDPPPGGDIVRIMGLVPLAPWWPRTSWLFLHSERTGDEKGRWDQGTGYVTEETEAERGKVVC